MSDDQFERGLAMRKQVMGEDFVARAYAGVTDFTAPIQTHITRNAWGDVWQRPGLDLKTRRCCRGNRWFRQSMLMRQEMRATL